MLFDSRFEIHIVLFYRTYSIPNAQVSIFQEKSAEKTLDPGSLQSLRSSKNISQIIQLNILCKSETSPDLVTHEI